MKDEENDLACQDKFVEDEEQRENEEFGLRRGEIAHRTNKATSQVNPKDELDAVNDIMVGIKRLDELFSKMLKSMEQ